MNHPFTPAPDGETTHQPTPSKALRQRITHSHNHATKSATLLKRAVVASAVGLVLAGGALTYAMLNGQRAADNPDAKRDAANLVIENTTTPTPTSIESTLGFSVRYDSKHYVATGQVTSPKSDSMSISGMEHGG